MISGRNVPNAAFHDMAAFLAFEAEPRNATHTPAKEERIIRTFHTTAARYYSHLNRLIDTPEALEHDPVTIHRLLDRREARAKKRAARTIHTPERHIA